MEYMLTKYKRIMILDTSSSYLYIAFLEDGKIIYENISEGKNNHSDNLLKNITEALDKLNLQVKNFDAFVCGKGPGMYTGLRVSMTVAKTFAWTLSKPLYTISSLDILTSGYFKEDGIYKVMMKAKKDYSYTKIFEIRNGKYQILKQEEFLENEKFLNIDIKGTTIDNSNIKFDILNIDDSMLEEVTNIHALEPNYLRSDI